MQLLLLLQVLLIFCFVLSTDKNNVHQHLCRHADRPAACRTTSTQHELQNSDSLQCPGRESAAPSMQSTGSSSAGHREISFPEHIKKNHQMRPHETDPENPSFEPAAPEIADPARAPASESTSSAQYVRRDQASTPPANNNPYESFSSKMAPPSSQDGRALGHMTVPRGTLPYAAWTSSSFNGSRLDAAPPKSSSTHEVCGELQALPPPPPPRRLPPASKICLQNFEGGSMAPISSSQQLGRPVHKLANLPYAAWSGPSFMNSERGSLVAAAPPPESGSTQAAACSSLFNASTPASNPAATAASCQSFGASTSIPAASSQHPSTRIHRPDHQITPHNYTSAKASSERSDTFLLSERDEKRQKITQQRQVAAAQLTDNSNNPSASHHGLQAGHNHLVSPKDLIWESMKRYCAMVLDEESREFLGTAVLFVQQPVHTDQHLEAGLPRTCKSAWVTSVNALAGRKQVLVQNSNGESHLAVLLLTSVTFGLVFLSVHKMSATFGLAFLSMVTSPSSLPHRSFVDAQHGDLVYVFGYEVNSETEQAQTMPVVHLKLGRIVDAAGGKQDYQLEIDFDFASSMLGGARSIPKGFLGGLIVRADGLWTGLITCNTLCCSYRTVTDFISASKVYPLLQEI